MSDTFRTHDGRTLEQAASDLVAREVLCCMSSMVATLANAYGCLEPRGDYTRDLSSLAEQASELCAPVLDYEEAAREADWTLTGSVWSHDDFENAETSAEAACHASDVEPHEWDVFEHWAVSTWLAEKLEAAGERVDMDFAGLCVWARTTTGQAISMDSVIERITREIHAAR